MQIFTRTNILVSSNHIPNDILNQQTTNLTILFFLSFFLFLFVSIIEYYSPRGYFRLIDERFLQRSSFFFVLLLSCTYAIYDVMNG